MRFWLPILVPSAPYCSASSSHLHCRASRVARNQAKVGAAASEPAEPEPLSLALALALALSCSLMPPSGLPPPATNSSPCFGLAVGKRRRYGGMFCCGALGEGLVDLCQGPDVVRADADESFGQERATANIDPSAAPTTSIGDTLLDVSTLEIPWAKTSEGKSARCRCHFTPPRGLEGHRRLLVVVGLCFQTKTPGCYVVLEGERTPRLHHGRLPRPHRRRSLAHKQTHPLPLTPANSPLLQRHFPFLSPRWRTSPAGRQRPRTCCSWAQIHLPASPAPPLLPLVHCRRWESGRWSDSCWRCSSSSSPQSSGSPGS